MAITDPNLHGAVEFFKTAARDAGIKPIIGAEVVTDGHTLNLYVENAVGYENLCAALCRRRGFGARATRGLDFAAARLVAGDRVCSIRRATEVRHLAVHSHAVLAPRAPPGKASRGTPLAMSGTGGRQADGVRDSLEIAERCEFEFDLGGCGFRDITPPTERPRMTSSPRLAFDGVCDCATGDRSPLHEQTQLREELGIIAEVGYEEYFLTTWEILQECRRRWHRLDHAGERRGFARVLLPGHF